MYILSTPNIITMYSVYVIKISHESFAKLLESSGMSTFHDSHSRSFQPDKLPNTLVLEQLMDINAIQNGSVYCLKRVSRSRYDIYNIN